MNGFLALVEDIENVPVAGHLHQKQVHYGYPGLEPAVQTVDYQRVLCVFVNQARKKLPDVVLLAKDSYLCAGLKHGGAPANHWGVGDVLESSELSLQFHVLSLVRYTHVQKKGTRNQKEQLLAR